MLALLLLYVVACVARVIYVGAAFEYKASDLAKAVMVAQPGDAIELKDAEYVVSHDGTGVCLSINRPITIRAAAGVKTPPIIRAANADGTDVVIGIGVGNVRLENFVIGRPAAGAQVNVDRVVAILVSAGTQAEPSPYGSVAAYGATRTKRSAPLGAIHAARELKKRSAPSGGDAPNRALVGVSIVGVDFTASLSHTNIAFGAGAYVDTNISACRFSASAASNALVTAPGARFETARVERNSFDGSPVVLNGIGLTLGSNYWAASLRAEQSTYCLDKSCTRFGPVVDGDAPTRAFASISDAVIAGVTRIVPTVRDVEWARSDATACAVISVVDTSIEGVPIDDCTPTPDSEGGIGVTNINLRRTAACHDKAVITTREGALASVSNVQFTIHGGVTTALAVVPGAVTGGERAATLLFDHVTMYGAAGQTALELTMASTRAVFNELELFGVTVGIRHHSGSLSITESVFVVEEVGVHLGGPAKKGLRVVDTLFFKAVGVSFGDVKSSDLSEFYVSCSRFLFSSVRLPVDCDANSATCASGLRHNTFIATPGSVGGASMLALLTRGANHYEEEDDITAADQYYKYTADTRRGQFAFTLHDSQGRIDDASGAATIAGIGTRWTFALVTHIPLRQECFAATVPSVEGAKGRVVSNLFDLRTDAPSACVSVALRVTLRGADVDLQPNEDMSIYAVEHIGSVGARWTRAAAHTVSEDGASTSIDASSGRGQLLRAVVVAAHRAINVANAPPPTAQPHAALAVTRAARQLCVACGGDRIPANVLDDRCGGGTSPVFTSLDAAFAALASSKTSTASLLVYGDKCVTTACSVELSVMAPNKIVIEGLGPTESGAIRRPSSCAVNVPFLKTGLGVTLRYLLIAADTPIASAIATCAIEATARAADGPRLAYLTVSGGVCIGKGRVNSVLLNNEVSVAAGRAVTIDVGASAVLDSNVFLGGPINVNSASQLLNNVFGLGAWLDVGDSGQIVAMGNSFVARHADATTPTPCLVTAQKSKTQFDKTEFGEHCELRLVGANHQLSGGVWRGVRAYVTGASHLVGVTLGSGSFVQAVGGVVLENVVVDLSATTVSAALRGTSIRTTACARQNEPALGGFALDKALVYDERNNEIIRALVWPKEIGTYVDGVTAAVKSCVDEPTSTYCICAITKPKSAVQIKPTRERVAPKETPAKQARPLAAADDVKQKPLAAAANQKPAVIAHPAVLLMSSSDSTSFLWVWILLAVVGVGIVCCFIVLALVYRNRRAGDGEITTASSAKPRTVAYDLSAILKNK